MSWQAVPTRTAETVAWIRTDLLIRLLPFGLLSAAVWLIWHPAWLGFSAGRIPVQLGFALLGAPLMFTASTVMQAGLARHRGALRVPANRSDLWLQTGFYLLNAPLEEAVFRGLLQGGLGALVSPWLGFAVGTLAYVLYHRLGRWPWPDVAATALLGVPLGVAFWFLPGPASLLGVSVVHAAATCGFLGPGPYLLHRLRSR